MLLADGSALNALSPTRSYFADDLRFTSSTQFKTALKCVTGGDAPPDLTMRNRWPSAETSWFRKNPVLLYLPSNSVRGAETWKTSDATVSTTIIFTPLR
jgi:hypothetical protein